MEQFNLTFDSSVENQIQDDVGIITGFDAVMIEHDSAGVEIGRTMFSWGKFFKFETVGEVEIWEKELRESYRIGDNEIIEPRPIYKQYY